MRRVLLALLSIVVGIPAGAVTISFDEIPPANNNWYLLSDEYAHMGVQFLATDDGAIWSGLSDGDPGGWSLEGTNGSAFVGFNGRSYLLTMLLDQVVEGFQLDVARAAGSSTEAGFALAGFRDGEFVEETFVDLGATGINEWSTARGRGADDRQRRLATLRRRQRPVGRRGRPQCHADRRRGAPGQ